MKKIMKSGAFVLLVMSVALSGSLAFAQSQEQPKGEKAIPAGWSEGEKKGWQGSDTPPGLAKKEAKEAKTEMSEAEKEAKKAEKEKKKAEHKAKKEKEELEKQNKEKVKKAKKEAENQNAQKAVEKQKKHPKLWPFGKKNK